MSNENYLAGVRAAQAYYNSPNYSGYTREVRPEDAMRLFLPPVQEQLVQISMPLPKDRQEWLSGFKEEQAAILAEEATHESTET